MLMPLPATDARATGLSREYDDVYALDLLGWGRSSRPAVHDWFSKSKYADEADVEVSVARDARRFWVASVEAWRQQVCDTIGRFVTPCMA